MSLLVKICVFLALALLVAAQDGKCVNGKCPKGLCCSKYGYCGTGKDYCGGCFSAESVVEVLGEGQKRMKDLAIGDKVKVSNYAFEPVYAFGHKDASAFGSFVRIEMQAKDGQHKSIELTEMHFLPIHTGKRIVNKPAKEVNIGDTVQAFTNVSTLAVHTVTGVSEVFKAGLFNPYTMSGSIVVDGVLASVHSEWFLDGIFQQLGLTEYLPMAYQVVLYPVRLLYSLLGDTLYKALYLKLDSAVDIAKVGTEYGGMVAGFAATSIIGLTGYYYASHK